MEEGRKRQGHGTKAKRTRVNKPGVLQEKQSQGNMGYFAGNFFPHKINPMVSSYLDAKLSSDNFQIKSLFENKIVLRVLRMRTSLSYGVWWRCHDPCVLPRAPGGLNQHGCSKREQHFQQVVMREKGRVKAL